MASVNMDRVDKVLNALEEAHPGAQLLVNDAWSIYYLTGFYADMYERFSGLLLQRGRTPVFFDNELYPIEAYDNAEVVMFTDNDDVTSLLMGHIDPSRPLGVDASMRSGFLVPLQKRGAASNFFLGSYAVTAARTYKDAGEKYLMRESSRKNDAVMAVMRAAVHEGVTEEELERVLAKAYKDQGCSGYSFEPIISFGSHAADPHHAPDGTVLRPGQVVLFDIGGRYKGYCSDMTRVFFWGEPDEESRRVYDVVREANERAEAIIRPGMRFCDIDKTARDVIADAGYGPYFTHRLGHSIGLQDHEPNDVSAVNTNVVEPGMTFSIEPGVYLPGRTGVRIEDLVLVTDDGVEVLNSFSKEPERLDL